ncbi:helix-turn-helix domain-containing protein [Streptomyces huiliensis]|uniref:helix-turn-helix domain-containing protein n=1 Tax=Streptomyces huiliensis TaxID=2876027 RepID=UPI001CC01998|nr:helix-turn-helix transcriptional regulator [Streptomyces huiliensis]MBZ4318935.1 helix-turn-helix domain-containing protein [Streptomyces huiliensis]
MPQSDMPTMRSKRLGNELRRLRRAQELTVSEVADRLECGQPKISQIENGKRGIRPIDLTILLDLYGVTDESHRRSLKQLAKDIHKVDWWTSQGPLLHGALKDYLTLEADSELVREYEPSVIPGLLQTEAYMRRLFTAVKPADQVEPLVQARMRRKELLDNHPGFRLNVVIDEPTLHRIPGPRTEASEQLRYLIEAGRRPNVMLQVLPLKARLPIDQYVPFSLFRFRGEAAIDVVWLEHTSGGTLLEQVCDVQVYMQVWSVFTAAALSPSASRSFIGELIKENRS